MKNYPSRLLVKLVKFSRIGSESSEIKNMLGIYKLKLDRVHKYGPVQPRYSHISNNLNTIAFTNSGWEFRVNNIDGYPQMNRVIFKLKETKNYFNDDVWRNNNGLLELKMTNNSITVHLIAF